MTARATAEGGALPLADMIRIDDACDRFEAAWRAGERPEPAAFLADVEDSARALLLRELLAVDLDYHRELGERPDAGAYRARFPEHRDVVDAVFAQLDPAGKTLVASRSRPALPAGHATDHAETLPKAQLGPESLDALRDAGYEILGELGRGGMGVVYLAQKVALNRHCALKMILAGAHAGASASARFRAEAEAIARLRHPGIVQIYHVGEVQGLPYLELEYLPGGSLDRVLDGTPWPAAAAARLLEVLARAIGEAHGQGIVHRDLKPANILLDTERRPKVADFGLAKMHDSGEGLTRTQTVLGSPSYMAPEQAEGQSRAVGPTTDVYALGAIFYELLTGRPPFRAATPLETLSLVRDTDPVSPSRLQPRLPQAAETICLKCLEKAPARRYPTAEALADDLHRFLSGDSILAHPAPPWEQAWRWTRHRPAIAAAVGVTLAAVALLLGGGLYYNARLRRALTQARAAERSSLEQRNLALNAYDQLVFDVHDRLGDSAETRSARGALLRTAIQGLDQIARGTEGSAPNLARAVAHLKLGGIYGQVGLAQEAGRQFELARRLAGSLNDDAPRELAAAECLRDALAGLGGLSIGARRIEEAKDFFRRVVALSEGIVQREPRRPEARRGLIAAHLQLGRAFGFNGERPEAEAWYRKMHDLAGRWVEEEPGNTLALNLLAISDRKLGDERKLVGDHDGAGPEYARAIAIGRKLVAAAPKNVEFRRHLALAVDDLAGVAYDQHRFAEARPLFEEAEHLCAEQVEADPADVDAQLRLVLAQSRFAGLEQAESHFDRAAGLFRRALDRLNDLDRQGRLEGHPDLRRVKIQEMKQALATCEAASTATRP